MEELAECFERGRVEPALAALDATPIERCRVARPTSFVRLTSRALSRMVPDALGVKLAAAAGQRAWRHSDADRRRALAVTAGIVDDGPLEPLAQARLVEEYVERELLRRPRLLDRLEVEGLRSTSRPRSVPDEECC